MANIGILTYHWVPNFGANLQTLSTVGYIRKSGHNPIVINWIPEDLETYYKNTTKDVQLEAHQSFQSHYGCLSSLCRSTKDIIDVIFSNKIDLIIIGSDAVLTYIPILNRFKLTRKGPRYIKAYKDSDFPSPFWADFKSQVNVPVAVMSASAQNTRFKNILFRKKKFAQQVKQFDYISVRDIWTSKMINYLTKGELTPRITPDPVFSFNQNISAECVISKEMIIKKYSLPDKYILLSIFRPIVSNDWLEQLSKLFQNNGITIVYLPKSNIISYKPSNIRCIELPIPPLDWYYMIKYSSGYIGELMHPILVSLHNSVPVYSIDTYGFKTNGKFNIHSSKILHILTRFSLLGNVYNINTGKTFPSPESIYEIITSFNHEACSYEAKRCLDDYESMMSDILKLI